MQSSNLKRLLHPVLIITILAIIIKIFGFNNKIPNFVVEIASNLGAMTIPLIMLVIGGNIYIDFKQRGNLYITEIAKFVIVKNFIFPIILLSILFFIRLDYTIALLLFLQAVVPPVSAVPIFTKRSGGNQSIVNQFVLFSFIISLVSIPIMISIFSIFYS
jgi:predicted permease